MDKSWDALDETVSQLDSKQHRLNIVSAQLKLFVRGELAISDQRIDDLRHEALQLATELGVPDPLISLLENPSQIINSEDYIPAAPDNEYFSLVGSMLMMLFNPILNPKGMTKLDQRLMYTLTVVILVSVLLTSIIGSAGVGMLFDRTLLNFDNFDAMSIFCSNPHEC
jgi:hypothetical protein